MRTVLRWATVFITAEMVVAGIATGVVWKEQNVELWQVLLSINLIVFGITGLMARLVWWPEGDAGGEG
jgi:hypothetical protein